MGNYAYGFLIPWNSNVTVYTLLIWEFQFRLEIVELKKDGLVKVGTWSERSGVNFTRNYTESYSEIVESLANKTLVVTTIRVRKTTFTFFEVLLFPRQFFEF